MQAHKNSGRSSPKKILWNSTFNGSGMKCLKQSFLPGFTSLLGKLTLFTIQEWKEYGLMVLLQRDRLNCYVHLFELACLGTPNNYPLYTLIASPRKNICFCCSSTPLLVSCAKKRNRTFRKLLFHDDQNVNVMTRLIYMSYCLKGYAKNNSSLL